MSRDSNVLAGNKFFVDGLVLCISGIFENLVNDPYPLNPTASIILDVVAFALFIRFRPLQQHAFQLRDVERVPGLVHVERDCGRNGLAKAEQRVRITGRLHDGGDQAEGQIVAHWEEEGHSAAIVVVIIQVDEETGKERGLADGGQVVRGAGTEMGWI